MAKLDPAILAHLEWIGYVRPRGLVVSAPALVRAGAILERQDSAGQQALRSCIPNEALEAEGHKGPHLSGFLPFAEDVLNWRFSPKGYAGTEENPIPAELELPLPEYGEILRPDYAVRELDPAEGAPAWQLLVRVLPLGEPLDEPVRGGGRLEASEHSRLERLLRHTKVPAGLLFNGRMIRLLSAPHGESSGWIDFQVAEMVQTAGRPICTALRLLLSEQRLLALPRPQRLAALLEDSRRFQNEVSERLAEQVLHALYELLRGLQAAHDRSKGALLRTVLAEQPDEVYRGLLTVLLRLVFLLYAEERDMLPDDDTWNQHYSLGGLHDRLREDAALYPDTMDQRYGAWARLLVQFRMIFDGAECGAVRLPRRHGVLFDPDRFPFLEGRPAGVSRQMQERIEPPLIPDGTVYRALEKLLVLDGERISYRALDVEQIGSVYETMMGFRLETATGTSVEIKAPKKHGAPTTTNLEQLLAQPSAKRVAWIKDRTDRKLSGKVKEAVEQASNLDDLHAALDPVIDRAASPDLVPKGTMVLEPSDERRRSGSHYTPRELTKPIVEKTLEPILARLRGADGLPPRPEQILDLKVCDPAMGSGAFLVEACRQLGDALLDSWRAHGGVPDIPADEDEVIYVRRLVAQRCLYGVDRNPVAVDLAKMSLWLATLARDHALTFVDHMLRHGDSLVGLSRRQLEAFHWDESKPPVLKGLGLRDSLDRVSELRRRIREAGEGVADWELRDLWNEAQVELDKVRLLGDLTVAAFFEGDSTKARERKRGEFESAVLKGEGGRYSTWLAELRHAEPPLAPFHWHTEFPEAFDRRDPGFDAFVGNPPFVGVVQLAKGLGASYPEWLRHRWIGTAGKTDLAAFFFRQAFDLLRERGCLGFLATNTIAQGDTRDSGLAHICENGGQVYSVDKRIRWPGSAAVIVSRIHIGKMTSIYPVVLSGRPVKKITAFLFHAGSNREPCRLAAIPAQASKGVVPWGMGFVFQDGDPQATPLEQMHAVLSAHPRSSERVHRFIGGADLNSLPDLRPERYIIDLGDLEGDDLAEWPALLSVVEAKVRPQREALPDTPGNRTLKRFWWRYQSQARSIRTASRALSRVLVTSQTSKYRMFAFVPSAWVCDQKLIVFASPYDSFFAVMQSRVHELWSDFFGTTMKDDPVYLPPVCYETFPFPHQWEGSSTLTECGRAYYEFRAELMVRSCEGLTSTYNRFHDPDEYDAGIIRLRELHATMDRAVLDAIGWNDIPTDCEFLLDFEIEDEEEWGNKKKPWRYRWPDAVHDEVLARLLELNAERAREEALAGATAKKTKGPGGKKGRKMNAASEEGDLFS